MEQTYNPNLLVLAIAGWCLKYVDDAGSAPNRTATAKIAFTNEKNAGRIRTDTIPDNVWLVGFLDFTQGIFVDYGHVFFIKRNGSSYQIYDSEVQSGARKPYRNIDELLAWFGAYKPRYTGWSTSCDGREYAKEKQDMKVDINNARQIAYSFLGRDGRDGRPNAIKGETDKDLKNWLDDELTNDYITKKWDSQEAKNYRDTLNKVYKERDELRKNANAKYEKVEVYRKVA